MTMIQNLHYQKLMFICVSVLALTSCDSNKKLDVYTCADSSDTVGCSSNCKKEKDFKYSFLVNASEKSVFQVAYDEGEQAATLLHKGCTIFSNSDWDCSETTNLDGEALRSTVKMANGVYITHTEITNNSTFKTRYKSSAICAK
jgi:hypothetical protein